MHEPLGREITTANKSINGTEKRLIKQQEWEGSRKLGMRKKGRMEKGTGKVEGRNVYLHSPPSRRPAFGRSTRKESELNSLLMFKLPPSSIWGSESKLVTVKLKLDIRIVKDSLSQWCHCFYFCRGRRAGRERRGQGQGHINRMCWRQCAIKGNSERKDGIALGYYWKSNNLVHDWIMFIWISVPFNLSCLVTILNTFSVSWITIPERPTRQGFLLWRTENCNGE